MSGRLEGLVYVAVTVVVHVLAVVPHILEYGWAWGWPGAGLGLPLALLGSLIAVSAGVAAVVLVLIRPKRPRVFFALRIAAVPLIVVGPAVVFGSFGGLAASEGRGLAARVRDVTPLDRLQEWAVAALGNPSAIPIPEEIIRTLPHSPQVDYRGDHVVLRWYDRGLLVGSPTYRTTAPGAFFEEQVRPGVYVYVVEH